MMRRRGGLQESRSFFFAGFFKSALFRAANGASAGTNFDWSIWFPDELAKFSR
jgi:hypothetical protein